MAYSILAYFTAQAGIFHFTEMDTFIGVPTSTLHVNHEYRSSEHIAFHGKNSRLIMIIDSTYIHL